MLEAIRYPIDVQMSLTMQQTRRETSGHLPHNSGAVKTRSVAASSVGTGTSGSFSSTFGARMTKNASSSTRRTLPHGPGPLPDKPSMDKAGVRYVAQSNSSRNHAGTARGSHLSDTYSRKSSTLESPKTRRKVSGDSGYGSSNGKERIGSYRYGELSNGRRSKSLSSLGPKEDLYPQKRDHELDKYQTRHMYTQRNTKSKPTLNGSSISCSSGIYGSTTHADYRDPRNEIISTRNSYGTKYGQSYSSEKSASSRSSYSIVHVDTARKSAITALPGSEMKCARQSSFSSSNSSPSNSVSYVTTISTQYQPDK